MSKNMSLYELTNTGNLLQAMFVEGEIDEQTLEDSRELIISELENKSTSLIMLWQEFFKFIGNGTSNKGLVFEEEKLVCIYAYAKEEGLEIREPLYLEGKEDLFWASVDGLREPEEKVSVYGLKEAPDWPDDETSAYKEKPLIMIRIVHLQELFSKMKIPSECEIHCSFAVIDPILHKNSRIWKLSSSKGEESLSVSETEDSQGVLSIAALTEILFGYKTPEEIRAEESIILTEELEEELRKLQNFCPIFLNEIV